MRHRDQASLRLLGHGGENHGDMITGMFASGAGNDDAGTIDPAVIPRGLQCERHLGPGRKRGGASEFNAAFVNDHGIG